jgi:hypothetical protein
MAKDPRLKELRRQLDEIKEARAEGRVGRLGDGGLVVPDVMEFVLSDAYLAQGRIYPRQGTLLKTVFLRDDLYTPADRDVIEEWTAGFRRPERPSPGLLSKGWRFEGERGMPPDTLDRVATLKAQGRFSFREVAPRSAVGAGRATSGPSVAPTTCCASSPWGTLTTSLRSPPARSSASRCSRGARPRRSATSGTTWSA